MRPFRARLLLLTLLVASAAAAYAQNIADFEKRVTVKKLRNGLTAMVIERPVAPVFSFFTHVNAGSVQDPKGKGGLAHMFEHMAFKGTDKIGTKNWRAERAALQEVERRYQAYDYERRKVTDSDPKKVEALKKAWEKAVEKAQQFVVVNEFDTIVSQNGGENLNAFTNNDETGYFYDLPSNRLELWAYLESERFLHPVMREFYKERDVVMEERRLRVDSNPIGRLVEQFVGAAFIAHPYHNMTIGFPSELEAFSATDAQRFFNHYYVPSNMVVAVVGDVKPAIAIPLIEKYFGRLPVRPAPEEISLVEPPQIAEREFTIRETAQPYYLEGYHRPDFRDPDDAVYDVITDLLSNGRTSRLYRTLVRDKKIAIQASGFSGFPGTKYPHLFTFFVIPARGHAPAEMRDSVRQEIENLKTKEVSDEELKMAKTRLRADFIRGLANNPGLAQSFATAQARYGDWRELFRSIDRIDKVTKADIRRIANKVFVDSNRTTGMLETAAPAASGSGQGANQ
ncbi:MAG: insulinase family protein [Acidobacteriales bacterium]|nr:insulinase family protein [Terriglobales bacterium]